MCLRESMTAKESCSKLSTTRPNFPETCRHFVSSHSHYTQALQHKNRRSNSRVHGVGDLQKGSAEGGFPDLF